MSDEETRPELRRITLDVAHRRGARPGSVRIPSADGVFTTWEEEDAHLALPITEDVTARFDQVHAFRHAALVPWQVLERADDGWLAIADSLPSTELHDAFAEDPSQLSEWARQLVDLLVTLHANGLAHGGLEEAPLRVDGLGRLRVGPIALTRTGHATADRRALGARFLPYAKGPLATWSQRLAESGEEAWLEAGRALLPAQTARPRYLTGVPLGHGGMGDVFRAHDRRLDRSVAQKVLRPNTDRVERFFREARLTARLQHPGIVSVHDLGQKESGEPFYVMEEVRGRSLDIMSAQAVGTPGGLVRVVTIFARLCETLAYAHAQGVVHRDVKPENVMVGEFGEVRLVDWGVAAEVGQPTFPAGTPGYAAPEQWVPGNADPRLDVYALGVLLQELIGEDGPDDLKELGRRCASATVDERPSNAGPVAEAVQAWLERRNRRAQADAAVAEAEPLRQASTTLAVEAETLRSEASAQLGAIPTWAPIEQKREAWNLEDRADAAEREAAEARARYEQRLRAALEYDPAHQPALDGIADLYRTQLLDAEAASRRSEVARIENLLRHHDGGRHLGWLQGDGALTLLTEPSGATVNLDRFEERDRRQVAVPVRVLGQTPLREVRLARGSWLLRIQHRDCEEVSYPVFLEREEHWDGVPPGEQAPMPIPLPPRGSLDPHEVYVPAGWFVSGGDPEATDGLPRRRLWVDGFVMQRFPVTVEQYLAFLSATEPPVDAIPRVPNSGGGLPLFEPTPRGWRRTAHGIGPYDLQRDWPISGISWQAARAYASWWSRQTGHVWELPHDQEWEKAARGVDGRTFPWGNRIDGTFARYTSAQQGVYTPIAVNEYPTDRSCYGLRGMAGNVRDWCRNGYLRLGNPEPGLIEGANIEGDPLRMTRGGGYASAAKNLRCAARTVLRYDGFLALIGFRLVRPLAH
ncbi:MAG: bifunctional serine/threonine-protein kinase/formylglycine-generating enzyme family protein [Myxococcota bacterium]